MSYTVWGVHQWFLYTKNHRFAPSARGQNRRYHPNYDHIPWHYDHIFFIDNEMNRCSLLQVFGTGLQGWFKTPFWEFSPTILSLQKREVFTIPFQREYLSKSYPIILHSSIVFFQKIYFLLNLIDFKPKKQYLSYHIDYLGQSALHSSVLLSSKSSQSLVFNLLYWC